MRALAVAACAIFLSGCVSAQHSELRDYFEEQSGGDYAFSPSEFLKAELQGLPVNKPTSTPSLFLTATCVPPEPVSSSHLDGDISAALVKHVGATAPALTREQSISVLKATLGSWSESKVVQAAIKTLSGDMENWTRGDMRNWTPSD